MEELGGGRVQVTVQTRASGLEQGGTITFVLYQTRQTGGVGVTRAASDSATCVSLETEVQGYVSGEDVTLKVEDLVVGDMYTFTVQARNRFGASENSSSQAVIITGRRGWLQVGRAGCR